MSTVAEVTDIASLLATQDEPSALFHMLNCPIPEDLDVRTISPDISVRRGGTL
jgi:hypothetical protein